MKKKKIFFLTTVLILFAIQVFSYSQERFKKKEKYLYKEKMAALKIAAILTEKAGDKNEAKKHFKLLAETCEETASMPFLSKKVKRTAKRLQAEALMKAGEIEDAIKICDGMLNDNPGDKATLIIKAEIMHKKARELIKKEKYEEANCIFREIISWEISPDWNCFFIDMIASNCIYQRMYNKALYWNNKIIESNPKHRNWPAVAKYNKSFIYRRMRDKENAKKMLEDIIVHHKRSNICPAAKRTLDTLIKGPKS